MRKRNCSITVNTPKRAFYICSLQIQKTKDVHIEVAKDYISVSANMNNDIDPSEMLSTKSRVLSNALKRAMMLHILLYGRPIRVKTYNCRNGQKSFLYEEDADSPIVYSLVNGPLRTALSPAWQDR